MSIRTKSVHGPVTPDDGCRVLVMRFWPRSVSRETHQIDAWEKDLAPSANLLRCYQRGWMTWDSFCRLYRGDMTVQREALERVKQLESEHGTVTLLCCERKEPGQPLRCHRNLLKRILDEMEKANA